MGDQMQQLNRKINLVATGYSQKQKVPTVVELLSLWKGRGWVVEKKNDNKSSYFFFLKQNWTFNTFIISKKKKNTQIEV